MNHIEFAQSESAALESTPCERWLESVERALGHDLDGDQDIDGYSIDGAIIAYKEGLSVSDYVRRVKDAVQ